MADMERKQSKSQDEMNQGFHSVFQSLQKLSQDILESRPTVVGREKGKKRKEPDNQALPSEEITRVLKRSALELMEQAEDDKESASEEERPLDSDLEQRNDSEERSEQSSHSEEEDSIHINPSQSKAVKPSTDQVALWESYLRRDGQFGPNEWKTIKVDKSVRKWNSHRDAMAFRAPSRNLQLPPIKTYGDQEREKSSIALQQILGAQAALTIDQWEYTSQIREQLNQLIKSFKQAVSTGKEGEEQLEALEIAGSEMVDGAKVLRTIIDKKMAPNTRESLRFSAAMFNKITLSRRKVTIRNMGNFKGSKDRLDECQPSQEFLFGAKLKELAKALKDEAQFSGRWGFEGRNPNRSKGGQEEFHKADEQSDKPAYGKSFRGGKFPKKKKQ